MPRRIALDVRIQKLTVVVIQLRPHLIHEQTELVLHEKFFKNKPFEKGIVRDTDAMYGAVERLWYHYFTTKNETNAAINTDGMQLARQIRDRMFERVKQPQKA